MITILLTITLFLIEGVALSFAVRDIRTKPNKIIALLHLNMLLILLLASKLLNIGGIITNIGTIFYATVVPIQYAILKLNGKDSFLKAIYSTYFIVTLGFSLIYILGVFPSLDIDNSAKAVNAITNLSVSTLGASFSAFAFSQAILYLIVTNQRIKETYKYILAILIVQLVDSLIFFPLAFGDLPLSTIWGMLWSGLLLKVILGWALYPFYKLIKIK